MASTDLDVIQRVARFFGVNIHPARTEAKEIELGYKRAYQVSLQGRQKVDSMCLALFPFMGERRQIAIANLLEVNQLHREGVGKERECQKCSTQ